MKDKYVQCKLSKAIGNMQRKFEISYIPSKYAIKGKILKIEIDGVWEDGWNVTEVYKNSETDEPPDWRKSIRSHRDNTGDSLPKNVNS